MIHQQSTTHNRRIVNLINSGFISKQKLVKYSNGVYHYFASLPFKGYFEYSFFSGGSGKSVFEKDARLGAIMECVERFSAYSFIFFNSKDAHIGTYDEFKNNTISFNRLISLFSSQNKRLIQYFTKLNPILLWHKATDLSGNKTILPASLLCLTAKASNGMAAGKSIEDATLRGLFEVIERHRTEEITKGKIHVHTISEDSILDQNINKILNSIKGRNEQVVIKDFSFEKTIPVICVIRIFGEKLLISTASSFSPVQALLNALAENIQKNHKSNYKKVENYSYLLRSPTYVSITSLPSLEHQKQKDQIYTIQEILAKKSMHAYVIDTSSPLFHVPTVQVLVTNCYFSTKNNFFIEKNRYVATILLSLHQGNLVQANNYISLGLTQDKKHKEIYLLFKGLLKVQEGDNKSALANFVQSSQQKAKPFYKYVTLLCIIAYDDSFKENTKKERFLKLIMEMKQPLYFPFVLALSFPRSRLLSDFKDFIEVLNELNIGLSRSC